MEDIPVVVVVAGAGFVAGLVLGATAQRTNFCTMGAISDAVAMGDFRRMRAWILAIAIALLGSQALHTAGIVDLEKSIYLTSNFGWLGAIVGGALFGFGMTLAGGCGYRNLVRLGAGNLKSLVLLMVLGIVAYMTLRGLLALVRVNVFEAVNIDLSAAGRPASQGIVELIAALFGAHPESVRWIVVGVVALGFLWFVFKDPSFRASPRNIVAGTVLGILVPLGWWITGKLGADDFEPVPLASFTFIAPVADGLQYLMTFTGASITFGIASVAGVIAGALLSALAFREFKVESFTDGVDFRRYLVAGALMGFGGVLALGCTIGQGITGMSTLALGSLLAWLSIIGGCVGGLKYLENYG